MKEVIKYSRDDRLDILGKRPEGGMAIDLPRELGYVCPLCKIPGENLHWSEYNSCLWCETCNKDIPSCLCKPNIDEAIDIFINTIQSLLPNPNEGNKTE